MRSISSRRSRRQQIIDPSLYFDRPIDPIAVSVDGYKSKLKDWRKIDEDTFGELSIQLILQIGYSKNAPRGCDLEEMGGGSNGDPQARPRNRPHMDCGLSR